MDRGPQGASAASMMPSFIVGWAWIVRAIRWAVAPSVRARVGSASISVTDAPTMWAPSRRSSSSKISFTNPSRSPAAVALPEAVKGKRPIFTAMPRSAACCSVMPTDATSGCVKTHEGIVV